MAKKWSQLTGRQRNERAARLSKNAGTLASIPTKYLKGFAGADKLRAQRAMNQRLDAEFVPGSGVSNRQVARDRNAALELEFGAPERELDTAIRDSGYHEQTRLPAWFADYRASIEAGQKRNQENAKFFSGLVQNLSSGDQAITGQHKGEVAASQAAQQQVTGAAGDPNAAQVADNASQIRRAMTESFGGGLVNQAAAQDRFLDDYASRVVPGLQFAEQQTERARGRKFVDEKSGLLRERGAAGVKYMEGRREAEGKSALERAVFGAETKEAEAKAEQDALKTNQWGFTAEEWAGKSQKERQRIIAQQKRAGKTPSKPTYHYGYTDKEWAKMSPEQRRDAKKQWDKADGKSGGSSDKPNKEPASSLGPRRTVNTRVDFFNKYGRDNKTKGRKDLVARAKRTHPGMFKGPQERFTSAALDLVYDGRISSSNLKWLRDNGVFVTSTGEYWGGGNR